MILLTKIKENSSFSGILDFSYSLATQWACKCNIISMGEKRWRSLKKETFDLRGFVAVLWRKEESTRGANEETGTVNRYIPSGEADCTEHRSPQSRLGSWRNSVTRHQASSSSPPPPIALCFLPSSTVPPPPHRLKNTAADHRCVQRE